MKKIMALLTSFLVIGVPVLATSFHSQYSVGSGSVDTYAYNTEAHAEFHGSGSFAGDFWSDTTGNYLDTDVDVSSGTGASLDFFGTQELSGYTNNEVTASAHAWGSTADMNLRFDNSMYVVQLERHDTSKDLLAASGSGYWAGFHMGVRDKTSQIYSAEVLSEVYDDISNDGGSASIDTNQWHTTATGSYGWGNPDGVVSPNPPGYYTPTNSVSATGSGVYHQYVAGANSATSDGMNLPGGGTINTVANFFGGFSHNPVMYAK